jgi:hypothetical protein
MNEQINLSERLELTGLVWFHTIYVNLIMNCFLIFIILYFWYVRGHWVYQFRFSNYVIT